MEKNNKKNSMLSCCFLYLSSSFYWKNTILSLEYENKYMLKYKKIFFLSHRILEEAFWISNLKQSLAFYFLIIFILSNRYISIQEIKNVTD